MRFSSAPEDRPVADDARADFGDREFLTALLQQLRRELSVDTAAILLLDASQQFLVAEAASGLEDEVRQGSRVRAGIGFAGRIAASRGPVILDEVTPANVVNPLLLRTGIASMLGVPLMSGDQVLGVLHIGSLRPRKFTEQDVSQVSVLAQRASEAIVRYRSMVDRSAAQALQASLIPSLPNVPGLELGARYVPGSYYGVGGDWYDIFTLPSGLISITVGDVMGHGLFAATVMGRLRSALRAYALEDESPASVLRRLDRKIHHFEPGHIATVVYCVLDPRTGHLRLASAGHLPPVLASVRQADLLDLPVGPPLGVDKDMPREDASITLRPGAMLCLYTDGLVESRSIDLDSGIDHLCRTLASAASGSVESVCADLMAAMLEGREPDDDITLLVASRTIGYEASGLQPVGALSTV